MKTIEFIFDNVLLKGLILKRERYYIEVQLISPFEAWENYAMISGMCRMTPDHLLTERGDKTIRRLLIESYKKFKMIYESFERVSNVYRDYKSELISLNEISDIHIRDKIQRKLEDWFFNAIFTSRITGVIATYNDRDHIFEIFENHLIQMRIRKNGGTMASG
jgi:hypothetical protein